MHLTLLHLFSLLILNLCHIIYPPGNHDLFGAFYWQNNTTLLGLIGVNHTEDIATALQVFEAVTHFLVS